MIFNDFLWSKTSLSRHPSRWAICLSANPFIFASNNKSDDILLIDCFLTSFSKTTNSSIWRKNQQSIFVISWILCNGIPILNASYNLKILSLLAYFNLFKISSWFVISLPSAPKPFLPISNDWHPFCKASWKERPIAITSPTDFICNPRVVSEPLNLSKFHLGIFITT